MAWGFFNKIKKGFKKAMNFVKNKVIKPIASVAKPIVNTAKDILPLAAPVVDKFIPGGSTVAKNVVGVADDILNRRIRLK